MFFGLAFVRFSTLILLMRPMGGGLITATCRLWAYHMAARHWGAWGDLSPQRGCKVLALCVPRYGMPNAHE